MLQTFSRIGKTKLRIQYDIEIIELKMAIPDGTQMRVRWKRGSSTENRTMDREANGNVVVFHDAMTIISTLWYDADHVNFLEKESTIQVIEVQSGSGNTIKRASLTFPLNLHCTYGEDVESKFVELPLSGGSLSLVVSSRCLTEYGDGAGSLGGSDEFSGSDQSELNEYPFPWDEEADWELNAPIHGEMEKLQVELGKLKLDQGQQLQDMHDEMICLDKQLTEKTSQERKLTQKNKGLEANYHKLETENKFLQEELGETNGTSNFNHANEEELLQQIDELQMQLSVSQNNNQVLETSCTDLHEAVSQLEQANAIAISEKARADKLDKDNRRLTATVKILQSELDGK